MLRVKTSRTLSSLSHFKNIPVRQGSVVNSLIHTPAQTSGATSPASDVSESSESDSTQENHNAALTAEMRALHRLILDNLPDSPESLGKKIDEQNRFQFAIHSHQIKNIISSGADPNLRLNSQHTPLHLAALIGNVDLLQFLLKRPDIDLDAADGVQQTALHMAVGNGFVLSTLMILRAITDSDKNKIFPRIYRRDCDDLMAWHYSADCPEITAILSNYISNKDGIGREVLPPQKLNLMITTDVVFKKTPNNSLAVAMMAFAQANEIVFCVNNFCHLIAAHNKEPMFDPIKEQIFDDLITSVKEDLLSLAVSAEVVKDIWGKVVDVKKAMIARGEIDRDNKYFSELQTELTARGVSLIAENFARHNKEQFEHVKTAEEKLQELQNLMRNLQKELTRNAKNRCSETSCRNMLGLCKAVDADINLTTTDNWSMLHLTAMSGHSEIVEEMLREKADVNLRTSGGVSVLRCAFVSDNAAVVKKVLSAENIDPAAVITDLQEALKAKNKKAVVNVLTDKNFIEKFSELAEETRKSLLQNLRTFNNQRSDFKHSIEEVRKSIGKFAEDVSLLNQPKVVPEVDENDGGEKISKNERDRIRKEQNRIKRAELEKQRKAKEEEQENRVLENEAMAFEDSNSAVLREFVKEQKSASVENPATRVVDDEVVVLKKVESVSVLSPKAAEFVPSQFLCEGEQVRNFLREKREINSISDLPEFLQSKLQLLLAENHAVLLKGSVVYGGQLSRIPKDLDIEIQVDGIKNWSDLNVTEFVKRNFDLDIKHEAIYRGPNQNGSAFAVNIKDEVRAVDFSIYDRNTLPDPNLDWNISTERKIFFGQNGVAQVAVSPGLANKVREIQSINPYFDLNASLFVNPQSHGLVTRLCFLQTIGYINRSQIDQILPVIFPDNPVDLVFKELKLDCVESFGNQGLWIKDKISNFMKSHDFDQKEQTDFVRNFLSLMSTSYTNINADSRQLPQYAVLFETVAAMCEVMPSNQVNPGSVQKFIGQTQENNL